MPTNVICFFDKITDFLDKGNAAGLISLEFSKEFDFMPLAKWFNEF